MTPATLEQPITEPTSIPLGEFPYGWTAVASTSASGEPLPFPRYYKKLFTHEPRTILVGAPKRGGVWENVEPKNRRQLKRVSQTKGTRYIVFPDRSLRRTDALIRRELATRSPKQQAVFMQKAAEIGVPA